jgi:hypothetical protein
VHPIGWTHHSHPASRGAAPQTPFTRGRKCRTTSATCVTSRLDHRTFPTFPGKPVGRVPRS